MRGRRSAIAPSRVLINPGSRPPYRQHESEEIEWAHLGLLIIGKLRNGVVLCQIGQKLNAFNS